MFDALLSSGLYVFAFVFVLSLVVVIHEGGHFWVARLCGVKVLEFSIGFGKELWHRVDQKGTRWKICAVPLGGYVKMLGDMDAASAKTSIEGVDPEEVKYTFSVQPLWKRAAIIFAGPAMNYVSAFLLLAGLIFCVGDRSLLPIVGDVLPGSAAEEAGILVGDRFLTINEEEITDYTDIQRIVRVTEFGKPIRIVLERNGERLDPITLMPRYGNNQKYPLIGVRASSETGVREENVSFFRAFYLAGKEIYRMTADTLVYLKQVLFEKRSAEDMRGPLGIAEASGDAMRGGFGSLLVFVIQISVAVGLMNLLPIPVLDGGHLFFYVFEAVLRRPLPEKVQNGLLATGMGVLLLLVVYTMFLDVPRIMQRILG